MLNFSDITSLNELLRTEDNLKSDDILDIVDSQPKDGFNPGNIGQTKKGADKQIESTKSSKCPNDIWDIDEIVEGSEYVDIFDPRKQPEYSMHFKQDLNTNDIYLGSSNKTPSSASCEYLVVTVKLPNTKYEEISLDVKEKYLDLRTSTYKLGLHLPNPVDADSGNAKWKADSSELIVTLTNKRDYDFINF